MLLLVLFSLGVLGLKEKEKGRGNVGLGKVFEGKEGRERSQEGSRGEKRMTGKCKEGKEDIPITLVGKGE